MVVADGKGVPLGIKLTSATPHEAKLIESTLDTIRVPRLGAGRPRKRFPRLVYDKAADSLKLRDRLLKERGIDLISPHRSNCKNRVQDGRKLRRYRRRWIIERTNAWLQNFRRIVVRYDRFLSSYRAFVTIACSMICLKRL
jgi:transposase